MCFEHFLIWNHKNRDGYKKKIKKPEGCHCAPGLYRFTAKRVSIQDYDGNMVSSMSTAAALVFINAANRPMVTGSSVSVKNCNDLMTPW